MQAELTSNPLCSLIDAKNARRYDDCLKYTVVSGRKALIDAGLDKEKNPEGYAKLDITRVGVLIGTGMGGLTVFQDGGSLWARGGTALGTIYQYMTVAHAPL